MNIQRLFDRYNQHSGKESFVNGPLTKFTFRSCPPANT